MGMSAAEYRTSALEQDLEEILRAACKLLRIVRIHQRNSVGTTAGVPDDQFIGTRTLWREIKTATGGVTPAQAALHDVLRNAGQDVAVWRPVDFTSGRVVRELQAIAPPPGHPARASYAAYAAAAAAQRQPRRTRVAPPAR